MAITDTIQAKEFEAGAPDITLKGDLRPNQDMQMAGYLDPMSEKNDMAMEMFGKQLKDLDESELELLDEEIQRLKSKFMADGGRAQYGLGSIVKSIGKAVKGVAKGVKSVAKSDLGKAALLIGGGMYAGGLGPFSSTGIFSSAPKAGFLRDLFTRTPYRKNLFGTFIPGKARQEATSGILSSIISPKTEVGKVARNFVIGSLATGALAAAEAGGLDTSNPDAEIDVEALKSYLRTGYQNLNPGAQPEEVEQFVATNISEYNSGGRVGLQGGGMDAGAGSNFGSENFSSGFSGQGNNTQFVPTNDPRDLLKSTVDRGITNMATNEVLKKFGLGTAVKSVPQIMALMGVLQSLKGRTNFASGTTVTDYAKSMNKGRGPITLNDFIDVYKFAGYDSDTAGVLGKKHYQTGIGQGASTQGFAMGGSTDDKVMAASGIEGLPVNVNSKGVKELDLRETGGFIPPVGIKEKADDIPAMLSNNEFVFTADAVRAAGGGDIDKGAQLMYDTMKRLESKVV